MMEVCSVRTGETDLKTARSYWFAMSKPSPAHINARAVKPAASECGGIRRLPANAIFIRQCRHEVIDRASALPNFLPGLLASYFRSCPLLDGVEMGQQLWSFSNLLKRKTCTYSMPTTFFLLRYNTLHLGNTVRRLARPSTHIPEGERSDALGRSNASFLTGMVPSSQDLKINNILIVCSGPGKRKMR